MYLLTLLIKYLQLGGIKDIMGKKVRVIGDWMRFELNLQLFPNLISNRMNRLTQAGKDRPHGITSGLF